MMASKKTSNVQNLRKQMVVQRPGDGADILLQETMVAGTYRGERLPYWRKLAMQEDGLTKLEAHAAQLFWRDYDVAQGDPRFANMDYGMERIDGTSGVDARISGPLWRHDARTRCAHILIHAGDRSSAALRLIVGEEWTLSDFADTYLVTRDRARGWLEAGLSCAARMYRLEG